MARVWTESQVTSVYYLALIAHAKSDAERASLIREAEHWLASQNIRAPMPIHEVQLTLQPERVIRYDD